jgi:hypothetical protein
MEGNMKYITYEDLDGGERYVIFDKITNHSDMAKYIRKSKVLGAGFVGFNFDDGTAYTYGKSDSMKVDSRGEEDSRIINDLNRI